MKSIFGSILLMFLLFYYALLKKLFVADSAVNMKPAGSSTTVISIYQFTGYQSKILQPLY